MSLAVVDLRPNASQTYPAASRLLKSAADSYGKLSALLGNETELVSRRALAGLKARTRADQDLGFEPSPGGGIAVACRIQTVDV